MASMVAVPFAPLASAAIEKGASALPKPSMSSVTTNVPVIGIESPSPSAASSSPDPVMSLVSSIVARSSTASTVTVTS